MSEAVCSACAASIGDATSPTGKQICAECGAPLIAVVPALPSAAASESALEAQPPSPSARKRLAGLKRPGFWGALAWCTVTFLVLQLLPGILCGYFLDAGSLVAHPNDPQSSPAETWDYGRAMLPWIAASHGASLVIVCLVFRWSMGPSWPRRLGLRRPTFYHVMLAILGLPGMIMVAGAAFQAALRWLPELYDFQSDLQSMAALPWYYAVLLVGVGPGIDEELWYRGFLGRGLVSRYGALVGILLTSFFFGLVHVDPRHAVVAFTMGTFLHLAYLASGSIWIPILMHTLNNTLSMAAMSVESTAAAADTVAVIPWTSYGGGVFLLSAIGWCFFKTRFRPAVQRKIGESSFPEADTADDTPLAARPSLSDWLLPPAAFIAFLSLLST